MTEYAPGTPIWVDLAAKEFDAAFAFYNQLFGWTLSDHGDEDFAGYRNLVDDGKLIAGIHPMGEFPAWSTYMRVDDADATAGKVTAGGGRVIAPPMDVGSLGRMAVFSDPEGAVFGVWQPGEHRGAEKFNAPISLCWNELHSRGFEDAKAFYAGVFGWEAQDTEMDGGFTYTLFNLGGKAIAGGMQMGDEQPAEMPPHWLVWFSVVDSDATVARAGELGAKVLMGPVDLPGVGRMAVVSDPQGAPFGVLQGETADE